MELVTQFKTADGKLFDDQVQAEAHELSLARGKEIEDFVANYFPSKEGGRANPHASTAVKAILLWIANKE